MFAFEEAFKLWDGNTRAKLGMVEAALAYAESAELKIDTAELEDARWFSRDDVAAALDGAPDAPFQAPPPAAITRTLLERWLSS